MSRCIAIHLAASLLCSLTRAVLAWDVAAHRVLCATCSEVDVPKRVQLSCTPEVPDALSDPLVHPPTTGWRSEQDPPVLCRQSPRQLDDMSTSIPDASSSRASTVSLSMDLQFGVGSGHQHHSAPGLCVDCPPDIYLGNNFCPYTDCFHTPDVSTQPPSLLPTIHSVILRDVFKFKRDDLGFIDVFRCFEDPH
ncbi:hypothetical protein CVT26_000403 [Gymnopilus dilepis]|uniref:Uncharacterized protein n=1 Tax=Gymnopilus dilepis TaxID=231916 RepID=A0A409VHU0_9AGAR|nr:hypothetical protein CVT26_000403 [Gymnopilus dilepis]